MRGPGHRDHDPAERDPAESGPPDWPEPFDLPHIDDDGLDADGVRWVLLDVIRDEEAAHEWLDALHEAGIAAELQFADGSRYSPLSSAYPTGPVFVYPLLVPEPEREAAARVLIELGWNGRGHRGGARLRRPSVGATALVVVCSLLLGLALLARAGG